MKYDQHSEGITMHGGKIEHADQPKTTTGLREVNEGEWTVEQMGDHAFDLKCGDKLLWTFATEPPARAIAEAHRAALAAGRENIQPEIEPSGRISRKDKALQDQAQIIAGLHQQLDAALAKIGKQ